MNRFINYCWSVFGFITMPIYIGISIFMISDREEILNKPFKVFGAMLLLTLIGQLWVLVDLIKDRNSSYIKEILSGEKPFLSLYDLEN